METIIQRLREFPREWDGKASILKMLEANYNWRQSEWPGFFFQLLCSELLAGLMRIPGDRYDTGDFDAFFENDWDFKTHASSFDRTPRSSVVILNDLETINLSLQKYKRLNFLVAVGDATTDQSGEFKSWHNELKGEASDYVRERVARGAPSRRLKTSFHVNHFEIITIEPHTVGLLKVFRQGRNSNGRARPMKYSLELSSLPQESRLIVN